jgi:Mg-chelatase subunit ChlD
MAGSRGIAMTFTNPAGWWLLALALPVLALHILRPRRQRLPVSSTLLWENEERAVSAAAPWQRLRSSWLLLAQLAMVALLAAVVAHPVRLTPGRLARHTVFMIDASGSMAATDGAPSRLEAAKDRAVAIRSELPDGGLASVVSIGRDAEVRLSASSDLSAFTSAVRGVSQTYGSPDAAGAFALAVGLETADVPIGFVLISDGGLSDAERRLLPPGTRFESVGSSDTNRAIVAAGVEPGTDGLVGRITVRNTGGPVAKQTVRFDVDGRTVGTKDISVEPAGIAEVSMPLPTGDRVEAFLEGQDLLSSDNRAFITGAARPPLRVLLAGPDDPYISTVLGVLPSVTVERSTTSRAADGFDLVIYDQVAVPAAPGAPFIAIAAPGGVPGVTASGVVEQPAITWILTEHPLLAGLDLTAVGVARSQMLTSPADTVLLGSERTPLVLTGTRAGVSFAAFGFVLSDSNLPVQVAYPVFMDRLIRQLSGAGVAVADLRVGDALPILGGAGVRVQGPGGARFEVLAGSTPHADRPGFWTMMVPNRPDRVVAVNVPTRESSLTVPRDIVVVTGEGLKAAPTIAKGQRSVLSWFAIGLLVLALLEFWLARRQLAVGRRQARWARGTRVVVVALVLGALFAPTVSRNRGEVATVFLVDGSDSLGSSGKEQAFTWVRQAISAQPKAARAAVAVFGGDARLELTLQHDPTLTGSRPKVDASATNLAGGLRLASALLPSDARRRVVIVSDGRPTTGDAAAEIDRLEASGAVVEVHPVARSSGPDDAVVRVDVPSAVSAGETFEVRATIAATAASSSRVTLRRDSQVIEERVVDLVPGDNLVSFPQAAGSGPVSRFQVQVAGVGDTISENDNGFAAVMVEGTPTVLIAEGKSGGGTTLAAALRAGGLQVVVTDARDLPGVEQLSAYAATVLVDVDARSLSAQQVAALTAVTRDGGRGLVVIGGDRSFALGGYRSSSLEDLLPVISEITDPKRRLDVAQVLAIDTSGSMAACHCAEGTTQGVNGMPVGGNMIGGGQDKTAISRAAAARTIQAMNKNDEVGVLAFNTDQNWVIPLQQLPADEVVTKGLRTLSPLGGTNLTTPLETAAESLKKSKATLKHIILFTDGFTSQAALQGLADQAGKLAEQGITVSVLATGEVAYEQLEKVAVAGRGRFYAGKDLNEIPQIMAQEAIIAARDVVQEGSFLPRVTSNASPVRELTSSPPVLGYLATTAKPAAATLLQVGDDGDPLLSSWRAGLGKVTAWTSDASERWSAPWANWSGYTSFWTGVVKDTFAIKGATGSTVEARSVGDTLKITVSGASAFDDQATAVARVNGPGGVAVEVPLVRSSGTTFVGETSAAKAGTFTVGAAVSGPEGPVFSGTAIASQSYSAEYASGATDEAYLAGLSVRSGGRGAIEPKQAFDASGLAVGRQRVPLAPWFLLSAALLWPVAVALSRLVFSRAGSRESGRLRVLVRRVGSNMPRPPGRLSAPSSSSKSPPSASAPPPPPPPPPVPQEHEPELVDTMSRLLDRKRRGGPS